MQVENKTSDRTDTGARIQCRYSGGAVSEYVCRSTPSPGSGVAKLLVHAFDILAHILKSGHSENHAKYVQEQIVTVWLRCEPTFLFG